jgi:P27 family predicted phage terminase small subunit
MPRRPAADVPPVQLARPAVPLELPAPPGHLSPAMQAWWREVMKDYDLEAHHLRLLEAACDAWDRMVQARETLAKEGLTVVTKNGTKRHPCADIERDSRTAFQRALRELDLDADEPVERPAWRPPALRSNRRR